MANIPGTLELRQIVWIVPIILLFHELEEWNMHVWHIKNSMAIPGETALSTRMWILFLSLVGLIWTAIALLIPNNFISVGMMYALVCFTLLNGAQHLIALLKFKEYNPGFFFSVIFGMPAGGYITYQILSQSLLPVWVLIAFGILMLTGLVATFPMIHFINRVGIKLADWISN